MALGPEAIGAVNHEPAPDERKGLESCRVEGLVIDEQPDEKLHGRRTILQKPKGGHANAFGPIGKKQERNGGHHADAEHENM